MAGVESARAVRENNSPKTSQPGAAIYRDDIPAVRVALNAEHPKQTEAQEQYVWPVKISTSRVATPLIKKYESPTGRAITIAGAGENLA